MSNNGIVEHIVEPEIQDTPINPMASLYRKKVEVMQKISAVSKSGYNEHFKYHYAPAAEIKHVARMAMAEAGLCLSMTLLDVEVKDVPTKNGTTQRTFANFAISLCDADTGMVETAHWQGIADDNNDKGVNKAATAALKYFLLDTFLISVDEEDDTDSSDGMRNPRTQQRSTQQRSTQQGKAETFNFQKIAGVTTIGIEGNAELKKLEIRVNVSQEVVGASPATTTNFKLFDEAGINTGKWTSPTIITLPFPVNVYWKPEGNRKIVVKVERA